MENFVTLKEASIALGISESAIRGKINRGSLAGKKHGKLWLVDLNATSKEELHAPKPTKTAWDEFIKGWTSAMKQGVCYNKPHAKSTITTHLRAMKYLLQRAEVIPAVHHLTIANLLKAFEYYPVEQTSCHFATKLNMRNALISATKYLVLIGLRDESDLDRLAKIKITRKVAPVRKFSNYETIERMLAENERMRMGRTNYETERIAVAIKLACYMGMRASEAVGLQWADIDLGERKLSFTGKGERRESLFITDKVLEALIAFRRFRTHDKEALFPKWSYNGLRIALARLREKAGVDINYHGLRHTFADEALRREVPLQAISSAMRHKDIKTTQGIYLHPTEDDRVELMRKWM